MLMRDLKLNIILISQHPTGGVWEAACVTRGFSPLWTGHFLRGTWDWPTGAGSRWCDLPSHGAEPLPKTSSLSFVP